MGDPTKIEIIKERRVPARCWHCRSLLQVAEMNQYYWRCGMCRRVNGRPDYARGFVNGILRLGLCRFYLSRIVHAVAVLTMSAIIVVALAWALPSVSRDYPMTVKIAVWAVSLALSANVVISFVKASRRSPGQVPRLSRRRWAQLVAGEECATGVENRLPWCDVCDNLKPPRAHHCSTCSTCVVEMDHHCVFLHNCVGAGNIANFIQLLVSLLAGTGFVTLYSAAVLWKTMRSGKTDLSAKRMYKIAVAPSRAILKIPMALQYIVSTRDGAYICLGALCLGVFCGVAMLAILTCRAVFSGETSLERSARLFRAGTDYRRERLGSRLSTMVSILKIVLAGPPVNYYIPEDHAKAVAAKLLDEAVPERGGFNTTMAAAHSPNGSSKKHI